MVTTEVQTDVYYYGDDYFMKLEEGFFVVVADSTERIGRQSGDVTINTNGDVRFGQKILTELATEKDSHGRDLGKYIVVVSNGKGTIVFQFLNAEDAEDYETTYMFSDYKKGFSGSGALKSTKIDALVHLIQPEKDPKSVVYEWTETTDKVDKNVTKALQIKKNPQGKQGSLTSLRFYDPKVDAKNHQVTITTKNMSYNVRDLTAYSTPYKRHSAKVPVPVPVPSV